MCRAGNISAVLSINEKDNGSDLVEYIWGNRSTKWGAVRLETFASPVETPANYQNGYLLTHLHADAAPRRPPPNVPARASLVPAWKRTNHRGHQQMVRSRHQLHGCILAIR